MTDEKEDIVNRAGLKTASQPARGREGPCPLSALPRTASVGRGKRQRTARVAPRKKGEGVHDACPRLAGQLVNGAGPQQQPFPRGCRSGLDWIHGPTPCLSQVRVCAFGKWFHDNSY